MFKKTKIAAATLALLSAVAVQNVSAVALDETGRRAEVMIFPYYNTNNTFVSGFNVRNTTNDFKAVKIRLRESKTSNDVLDFNVYLSPHDHFAFGVGKGGNGSVFLNTADNSCTFPNIQDKTKYPNGVELISTLYKNVALSDTFEGYVEVIEMGVIVPKPTGSYYKPPYVNGSLGVSAARVDVVPGIFDATTSKYVADDGILHDPATNKPKDCSLIYKAWDQHVFTQGGALADSHILTDYPARLDIASYASGASPVTNGFYSNENGLVYSSSTLSSVTVDGRADNIAKPSGGLEGYSILIDLPKGAAFVADSVLIRNYSTRAQHYRSASNLFYLLPSLASGSDTTTTYLDNAGTGHVTNQWRTVKNDWGLSDPNAVFADPIINTAFGRAASGINPLPIADVLAATAFNNDYYIIKAVDGATDWVVTMPMRKHGIFNDYRWDGLKTITAPATEDDVPYFKKLVTANDVNSASGAFSFYNNEEFKAATKTTNETVSPPVLTLGSAQAFPNEVNILSFKTNANPTNPVLGSVNAAPVVLDDGLEYGWGEFTFSTTTYKLSNLTTVTGWESSASVLGGNATGVPMVGFASLRGKIGANANDQIGETSPHIFVRDRQ